MGRFDDLEGDPRFFGLLEEMALLHSRKGADYGDDGDRLANVRSSQEFGVPNWVGVMIRANDKMRRIRTFAKHGSLKNESVEDSLIDLAAYALIALILYRETLSTPMYVDGGTVQSKDFTASWAPK